MKKIGLILPIFLLLFIVGNVKAIDISSCSELNQSGATYYLTQDIIDSSVSPCFNITANNITLDCQGHKIDGNGTGNGIYIYRNPATLHANITINNCTIIDWSTGIFLHSSFNTIKNTKIQDNLYCGVNITNSQLNLFYNNLFNNTKNFDLDEEVGAINYWNTTRQAGTRVYSLGTEIGGNYWTNSTGNGYSDTCTDSDKDGFCDNPYVLAGHNTDYLPLSDEFSCTCTDWSPQECINTHTRYYTRTCTPAGCDIEQKYESDPTCFSEIYGTSSALIPLIPILVLVGLVIYLVKSLTTGISTKDLIKILIAITIATALTGVLVAVIWF